MSERFTAHRRPLVWIVDDSPTEIAITERSLGPHYDYEHFGDGALAIERLGAGGRRPDLILLDWVMPGMSGDEVCRFVRSQSAIRDLPIIIVTASRVETADVVNGLEHGANDYVARPFAPEELRARVGTALRQKQLQDAATRERGRLATVNRLGRALFRAGHTLDDILGELASTLAQTICDGCAIMILPGSIPSAWIARHHADPGGAALHAIASVADPCVRSFTSTEDARASLPPAYAEYIERFGLRGLAILPFPIREPVQGVVTVTRDGDSEPFDLDDIATIETCIEYTGLAVESALRFDAERIGRIQLDAVLHALPIGVITTDEFGALNLVNAAARDLLPGIGTTGDLDEVFRLGDWTTIDGERLERADWVIGRALSSELPSHAELHFRAPASTRTLAISVVPLRDGQHLNVGSVTMLQDVSAERMIEAERERFARFQQELLGIVGHDLRNPLGAVVAGIDLLGAKVAADESFTPILTRVRSSTTRMTRIIDQLLDVTRARLGGGIPLALRSASLVPIAQAVLDEARLTYPRARFELLSLGDVTGVWDTDRLSQALSNLLGNAAQYGKAGAPVLVEVSGTATNAMIAVRNAIRDKPIAPEILASLFDPFRRGRHGDKHKQGLGLGLYIVHEIVRGHGGTLAAESDEDGTVFRIELPLRPPAHPPGAR